MLHKSHKLLLHEYLLVMHLLLLLEKLLLPLELILTSLELCEVGSGLLCLSCLVLLYSLKNSYQCGIRLRCWWS